MEFCDFEQQIFSIDQAIHDEISKHHLKRQPRVPQDLNELRATVRRAAEGLILRRNVDEAMSRLRQDPEACTAIMALTIEAPLSRDDHRLAGRRAFAAMPHEPNGLPFYPFCSYLIELCNMLEYAQSPMT
jgi:hypothetical protein